MCPARKIRNGNRSKPLNRLFPEGRISLGQAAKNAADCLRSAGIEEAKTDAALMLEKITGLSGAARFLHRDEELTEEQKQTLEEMLRRRAGHVPVQQILGEAWFYGRSFLVEPCVLIPRMDTEILVEEALGALRPGMSVLDLCTGSGCIVLTLAAERGIEGVGSDVSPEALSVARRNAKALGLSCRFVQSDLFENITGRYDLIVSNPPYIRRAEIETLSEEVKSHEPRLALDGGPDGLDFYRRIAARAADFLKPGGSLMMEIGYDQGETVPALLAAHGWKEIRMIRDLAQLPRVVAAGVPDPFFLKTMRTIQNTYK